MRALVLSTISFHAATSMSFSSSTARSTSSRQHTIACFNACDTHLGAMSVGPSAIPPLTMELYGVARADVRMPVPRKVEDLHCAEEVLSPLGGAPQGFNVLDDLVHRLLDPAALVTELLLELRDMGRVLVLGRNVLVSHLTKVFEQLSQLKMFKLTEAAELECAFFSLQ